MNECLIFNESNLRTTARMPADFIDLVVTSPPYDNLRTYKGFAWDFEALAKELFRVVKPGGVVVWVVGDATIKGSETGTSFRQALYFKEIGFDLSVYIWHKPNPVPSSNTYTKDFEYMFCLSKGAKKCCNLLQIKCKHAGANIGGKPRTYDAAGVRLPGSVSIVKDKKPRTRTWDYVLGSNKAKHPAVFPYQLAEDHILSWSNPDQIVYDPFMGSGTTADAALKNGRNVIGSEISSEYCRIIEDRLKDIEADKTFYYETSA